MPISKALALTLLGLATAAPLTSRQATIACPADDTATVGDYIVQCGKDQQTGNVAAEHTESFQACITLASTIDGAKAVAFVKDSDSDAGWCYVKGEWSSVNRVENPNVWGAALLSAYDDDLEEGNNTDDEGDIDPPSVGLTCPDPETPTYTSASTGDVFKIECSIDHAGGDIGLEWAATLDECLDFCGANEACLDVSYVPGTPNGPCYLKGAVGPSSSSGNVWGGLLVTPPVDAPTECTAVISDSDALACPESVPGMCYQSGSDYFKVECFNDYVGYDLEGDNGLAWTPTYAGCLDVCAATEGCLSVAWNPPSHGGDNGACYRKGSSSQAVTHKEDVWGAVKIVEEISRV